MVRGVRSPVTTISVSSASSSAWVCANAGLAKQQTKATEVKASFKEGSSDRNDRSAASEMVRSCK